MPADALTGAGGLALQCVFVIVAAGAAALGAYVFRGQAPYALTAAWALTGVLVSAIMAGLSPLTATAIAGLALVGAVALLRRHRMAGRSA